jgi:hypothetical protein
LVLLGNNLKSLELTKAPKEFLSSSDIKETPLKNSFLEGQAHSCNPRKAKVGLWSKGSLGKSVRPYIKKKKKN